MSDARKGHGIQDALWLMAYTTHFALWNNQQANNKHKTSTQSVTTTKKENVIW